MNGNKNTATPDGGINKAAEEKEKEELVKMLNEFTKPEFEKKYGVSSKLTKDNMIIEIIKKFYGEKDD